MRNVCVFGSVVIGDVTEDSDIDLLVEVDSGRSLLDVVGLWLDLQELLGRKVNLLTDGGVNRHLREESGLDPNKINNSSRYAKTKPQKDPRFPFLRVFFANKTHERRVSELNARS